MQLLIYWLAKLESPILTQYGKKAVPFILIALGLYLMYERGTFALLFWGQ
jgi:cadmium resistance protein CadD (predicted permease)